MCCLINASYPKVILTPILCQIQNLQVDGMFRGLQIVVIGYIVGVSILRNKGAVLRLLLPPHSFPLLSILGTMNRIPSFLTLTDLIGKSFSWLVTCKAVCFAALPWSAA